jgi:putative transcriptional regulator
VSSFDRDVLGKLCHFLQIEPGDLIVNIEQGELFNAPSAKDKACALTAHAQS